MVGCVRRAGMTKNGYYWAAAGLYLFGVGGLWVLVATGSAAAWAPLLIMGLSCWIAAAVLAVRGWLVARRSAAVAWEAAGLAVALGVLVVLGGFLLLFANFARPGSDFGR